MGGDGICTEYGRTCRTTFRTTAAFPCISAMSMRLPTECAVTGKTKHLFSTRISSPTLFAQVKSTTADVCARPPHPPASVLKSVFARQGTEVPIALRGESGVKCTFYHSNTCPFSTFSRLPSLLYLTPRLSLFPSHAFPFPPAFAVRRGHSNQRTIPRKATYASHTRLVMAVENSTLAFLVLPLQM